MMRPRVHGAAADGGRSNWTGPAAPADSETARNHEIPEPVPEKLFRGRPGRVGSVTAVRPGPDRRAESAGRRSSARQYGRSEDAERRSESPDARTYEGQDRRAQPGSPDGGAAAGRAPAEGGWANRDAARAGARHRQWSAQERERDDVARTA